MHFLWDGNPVLAEMESNVSGARCDAVLGPRGFMVPLGDK